MAKQADILCPCGSGQRYRNCCAPFISGQLIPETPEQLMRSRYTAYTQANVDYIAATMKGPAAEGYDKPSARQWAKSLQWVCLKVLMAAEVPNEDVGFFEFIAVFRYRGAAEKMQERSEFRRINGQWYYWDGLRDES